MKPTCNAPETGVLIHAYELDILSETDKDRFETHLLECTYCFMEFKEYGYIGKLLVTEPELAMSSQTIPPDPAESRSWFDYFWPRELPLIIKPAILTILIALLLYPAYQGLFSGSEKAIAPVQEIGLVQMRSEPAEPFQINPEQDLVLSFRCPDDLKTSDFTVELYDLAGTLIYSSGSFTDVDKFGFGKLLIPKSKLRTTLYRLKVTANTIGDEPLSINYKFELIASDSN